MATPLLCIGALDIDLALQISTFFNRDTLSRNIARDGR